jgi:hypothetical protein
MTGALVQVIEHLPGKCETLHSNPSNFPSPKQREEMNHD